MANVTLPTPVFVAGGALCLVAGYLLGSVTGPGTPERTTGTVVSFDRDSSQLCLEGEAIREQEGVDAQGHLCGTWRRPPDARTPRKGDAFRFVSLRTAEDVNGRDHQQIVIYGDVTG